MKDEPTNEIVVIEEDIKEENCPRDIFRNVEIGQKFDLLQPHIKEFLFKTYRAHNWGNLGKNYYEAKHGNLNGYDPDIDLIEGTCAFKIYKDQFEELKEYFKIEEETNEKAIEKVLYSHIKTTQQDLVDEFGSLKEPHELDAETRCAVRKPLYKDGELVGYDLYNPIQAIHTLMNLKDNKEVEEKGDLTDILNLIRKGQMTDDKGKEEDNKNE